MADTGAPWNIPYVEPTDLVREYPAANEAMAEAVAAGLTLAGGLVAVKSAIFTGTQSASTAAGANFAVTDLTITHEVADVANKLIITAVIGVLSGDGGFGEAGIAVDDGTSLIGVGDASGSRTPVSAGGNIAGTGSARNVVMPSVTFVHTPGSGSKTYTVRAINTRALTQTIFVNRDSSDADSAGAPRGVSSLVIQEVKV